MNEGEERGEGGEEEKRKVGYKLSSARAWTWRSLNQEGVLLQATVCVCVRARACVHACVCVVSVIVKGPVLPPSVVDGRSRNPLYSYSYYYYY